MRGLSKQELADRLTWLAWYQPGVFTAVMDYMDFSDGLAADTDPTGPDLAASNTTSHPSRYAADAALTLAYSSSSAWTGGIPRGCRPGQAEIFDPGHAAELAWRRPGPAPART